MFKSLLLLSLIFNCYAYDQVFTFAFENSTVANPNVIDTSLTCWSENLGLTQAQTNIFIQDSLNWYSSQFGVTVNLGTLIPNLGWLIPSFGVLVPSKFDSNYLLVASNNQAPQYKLVACNLILVPLPLFIPAFTEYGGAYRAYCNSRGFTSASYKYVQLDDNLVYGAYAVSLNNVLLKQVRNKSYLPLFNNGDFNTRSERAILEDLSGEWGQGILYGASNVYSVPVNGLYIHSARATWTFPGTVPLI